jgi:hypothetical protein
MHPTAPGSVDRFPGRRAPLKILLAAFGAALFLALAFAGRATAIPSAVIVYGPRLPAGIEQYAGPGNVIVVDPVQRILNPDRIRAWRAKGTIVMAYVNLIDFKAIDEEPEQTLYGGNFPKEWFYPGNLSNFGGKPLLNLGDDCPVATYNGFTGTWGEYAAHWIKNTVIKDGSLFNGVDLDVWGDQLYSVPVGGPGTHWEKGVAKYGQLIRSLVGPNIFLIGNNTQSHLTAAPLNGRMWESFSDQPAGGYNLLTGTGNHPGLKYSFTWPEWQKPQLDLLWRNEADPSQATKDMLLRSARSVSRTNTDVAVGAAGLPSANFPPPFGDGGSAPPGVTVPASPPSGTTPAPPKKAVGGSPSSRPKATRLVLTDFAGGSIAPFATTTSPKGRVRASGTSKGGKVALVAGHGAGQFAAIKTTFAAHRHTTVIVRVRVPKLRLPAGRARALVIVSSPDGTSRQVGVMRHRGALRWASWVRTTTGKRVGIVIGKKTLTPRTWVRLRLTQDWRGGKRRDVVKVAAKPVLRAPVGPLAGKAAQSLTLGLGRSTSSHEAGGVIVRSVAVVGRS